MQKLNLLLVLGTILFVQCNKKSNESSSSNTPSTTTIANGLKYCESTLWNGNDLYIANFGGTQLNPLNQDGKGYIAKYTNGVVSTLIPATGVLNAPKGTAVKDNHLFIADVGKVVVYDLSNISTPPTIISLENGAFVNDLFIVNNTLYVTVTDANGGVYSVDISNLSGNLTPIRYTAIPGGANGIYVYGNTMYVASYPTGNTATADNVIYTIDMTASTATPVKWITTQGFYDGLAMSADGKMLYFTDWVDGSGAKGKVGKIDVATKAISYYDVKVGGPAKLTLHNDSLYIPDLPNSKVVVIKAN